MLRPDSLRPGKIYWVVRQQGPEAGEPQLATLTGQLPCCSLRLLNASESYPSCSHYQFLGEADIRAMFDATFKGLSIADLLCAEAAA